MLTLLTGATKLLRSLEHKANISARKAGDRARVSASKALNNLKDTAVNMRNEADDLEVRAKATFASEMKRIEGVLEGI